MGNGNAIRGVTDRGSGNAHSRHPSPPLQASSETCIRGKSKVSSCNCLGLNPNFIAYFLGHLGKYLTSVLLIRICKIGTIVPTLQGYWGIK